MWEAIEDSAAEAETMKLCVALRMALEAHIRRRGWTHADAAERLGMTQPRVSDLRRSKIALFGLDTLVNMATAAGLRVALEVEEAAA